jgi:hypothetical protein
VDGRWNEAFAVRVDGIKSKGLRVQTYTVVRKELIMSTLVSQNADAVELQSILSTSAGHFFVATVPDKGLDLRTCWEKRKRKKK